MNYTKRVVKGTTIVFVMSIISAVLGFFLRAFLARNLSVAEFGLLYSVLAFIGLFSLFRDIGLNPALIKYIPEYVLKKDKKAIKSAFVFVFLVQISISTLAMVPVFVFSDFFAKEFFKTPLSIPVLHFFALTFIASVLFHLLQAFFQGFQKMGFYSILEPMRLIFVFGTSIVLISFGLGVKGVSIGYFLGIILAILIGSLILLKTFPLFSIKGKIDGGLINHLFKFAFPVILAGVASASVGYADTILLTYFKNLEEVGYYQVAIPISDAAGLFVGAMSIVLFPMVSELWALKKKRTVTNGIHLTIKISLLVLIPVTAIVISSPEIIISILFTDKYLPAAAPLQILTVGIVFQSLTIILFFLLKGIGRPMVATKAVVIMAIMNLVTNVLLIPPFGILGAAIATAITSIVTFLITVTMTSRYIHLKLSYMPVVKIVFSGIIMALVIIGIKPLMPDNNIVKFSITSLMGIVLYISLVFVLGAIKKREIKILATSFPKINNRTKK